MSKGLSLLFGVVCVTGAHGQCVLENIDNPLLGQGDFFGGNVAVHGAHAAVSSNWSDLIAPDAGLVHMYEDTGAGWAETQTVAGSAIGPSSIFGVSLDLVGDRLVVGAFAEAYVFVLQAGVWNQIQRIVPSGSSDVGLTSAVLIDGDQLFLGYPADSADANRAGAVYAFKWQADHYNQVDRMTASDMATLKQFGTAIAKDGGRMVIGSSTYIGGPGSAYVLEEDAYGWNEVAILEGSDAEPGEVDRFGSSTALRGDVAFVGASGLAYVFEFDGSAWVETDKLGDEPDVLCGEYGTEIDFYGDVVLISSCTSLSDNGKIHLVQKDGNGWISTGTFQAPAPPDEDDGFGGSMDVDGNTLFVGNYLDPKPGISFGEFFVYRMPDIPPPGATLLAAPSCLSVSAGGSQTLEFAAGSALGAKDYWVLGSLSGTSPGITSGSFLLPLNPDPYFLYTVSHPGSLPLVAGFSVLDAEGAATVQFQAEAGALTAAAGLRAHHAVVVFDLATLTVHHTSNAVSLDFAP